MTRDWPRSGDITLANATTPPVQPSTSLQAPAIREELLTTYRQWHQAVHTLELASTMDAQEMEITGQDFLRSPGFNGFTFAIALKALPGIEEGQKIAEQKQLWALDFSSSQGELTASFQSHSVTSPWKPTEACVPVILTGNFKRKLNHWKNNVDHINFQLYIDGELKASYSAEGKLDDENYLQNPTRINPKALFNKRPPIFFSRQLTPEQPLTVAEVSQSLCP